METSKRFETEVTWWNDNSDIIWDMSGTPSLLLRNEAKFL